MGQWVALLRGINLGRRRVKNPELVAAARGPELASVQAYQASGNLLLRAEAAPSADALAQRLEAGLGFEVKVFLRSAAELREAAEASPFAAQQVSRSKGKPQVTFLAAPPSAAAVAEAEALSTPHDQLRVVGRQWHWLPAAGISGTELDVAAVERLLGVGTTRTLGTVQRIVKKLQGASAR